MTANHLFGTKSGASKLFGKNWDDSKHPPKGMEKMFGKASKMHESKEDGHPGQGKMHMMMNNCSSSNKK